MPSESKPLLTAQTEKPNHYKYLKEFRVEQCPSFLQHKCTQHRPFTCFHWHFNNQRRRRPVRKRDGSFNYSADNYCTKYNETSGICEDGDECPYLHRTAGDTERRYHLRYYKTCMCVHDTDARGLCTKNGAHCAFAHGAPDLRPPVLDARELQALDHVDPQDGDAAAPNALDRERNLMNEDPKWQDTNYVLSSYKTEPCKRPPRLCRQGYACPQYHNSKDKRRSPRKYKYRSTPCPNVKHGEEWGEPSNCEAGEACGYCHTRTEQQFHPEIYKSTKCNDVQQAGYCPRGLFCAFAHVEREYTGEEWGEPGNCEAGEACGYCHTRTEQQFHPEIYKSTKCNDVQQAGYCPRGLFCAFAHVEREYTGEEWGEPGNCEAGEACGYCHTRTEQQFHPEIYKSTKCNDVQQAGYCPRGLFCAFAHVEREYTGEEWGEPGNCEAGEACGYCHTRTEQQFHPEIYKSTKCNDVQQAGYCPRGLFCAFAHVEREYTGEEWGEPGNCEAGEACGYCHTRTEQQFHPEIYKSTKCNDVQQAGYCPRGLFCAFAHVEREYTGEEWGEPGNCEAGEACGYCHTRTEQQFHPEIYKSTKCNDVQQAGYCPRGLFCAFAHVEREYTGEEWGEPGNCEAGEACGYCHTRTEQQFHPEIYKSTKCNDVQQAGYCPRGLFCAFAHVEREYTGEEWGEPGNCEAGEACGYCHTRTEQQFHPEIYKSTKCNDVQQAGYCPRGLFCAFAHVEREYTGEEWGEPGNCEAGEACGYCHTRTEQQFHPEIYKSTKCNDVQQAGYCPRGLFCAFAHVEREYTGEEWGEPGNCEAGEACGYCHTRTEQQFHPEIYKSTKCNDVQQAGYCPRGLFCAFAHVEREYTGEEWGEPGNCEAGEACGYCHTRTEQQFHPEIYKSTKCNDVQQAGYCPRGLFCAFAHVEREYTGEEWGEPGNCEAGEACGYCHTRTEQQFHPEIYKSTKCNDVQQAGYCPRGLFCAFAHVEREYTGEEWGEPGNCEAGEACGYCHTRTEQQFHPEIYKSTKCNDVQQAGYCPRGLFCAFAHVEREYTGEEWGEPGNCEAGEACGYCHTRTEQQFHPEIYKSTKCNDVQQAGYCPRGLFCAFAHVEREYTGEEWGEPGNCEAGEACGYCHTRTEQQFHPEIYKSTKCNDVQQAGYCPRGLFCAFAHVEREYTGEEWGEPGNCEAGEACGYCHTRTEQQFHPEIYKSTKCNDVQQAGYCPRGLFCAFAHVEPEEVTAARELTAPLECGTNLAELLSSALPDAKPSPPPPPPHANGSGDSECASTSSGGSSAPHQPPPPRLADKPQGVWAQRTAFDATVLQEVVGNALDDLHLDDPLSLVAALDRDLADGEALLAPSAPVNIPRAHPSLRAFSPPAAGSPLPPFLRYAHDTERIFNSHATLKTGSYGGGGFEFAATSPSATGEISRLREEVVASRAAALRWDERIAQARSACGAWQREADEAARAAALAERQRDEAVARAHSLRRELDAARAASSAGGARPRDLRTLPLGTLKQLQAAARADLEEIEKVLYLETATKCMACEERPRAVTLAPCNHYVLCDACARAADECPYCQTPVQRHQ